MAHPSLPRLLLAAIAVCLICLMSKAPALAEPQVITFQDLPDPAAQGFADPFKAMGYDMLQELRTVVRQEARLTNGEISPEALPRLRTRIDAARARLETNGYDIAELLSQRWTVAENRRRAMFEPNPALDNNEISLSGFLIPAGRNTDGVHVGYLVSQVGMCSHIPPPPPNQLVRVSLPQGVPTTSLYQPVQVTGTLHATPHDETIYLLDGEVRMVGSWTMVAQHAANVDLSDAGDKTSAETRSFRAFTGGEARVDRKRTTVNEETN
ncbi:DUF3299 domain-containing protein [Roseibium aggregatum]|uniref:DUF3299 domain-containing protein n=1 Tax=Roseibium aggregatum TaxID=187304 RepID=A0A926NXB1_9HYPH|nr:DUF3299 domain-containing protein [Roseibium aggregatum]MBD1545360.1 DUF3299 domain-containing protein [Roseibium aggregatum]